jgi:hypothetical protein
VKCRGAELAIDRSLVIRLSFVEFMAILKKNILFAPSNLLLSRREEIIFGIIFRKLLYNH